MIDKKKIKKSFSTRATTYDQSAHLQQKVGGDIVGQVKALGVHPGHVLDIGTGTGYIALAIKELFPTATVQACDIAYGMVAVARAKGERFFCKSTDFITADAEFLPYHGERFDLVTSSLTYQWLDAWARSFGEVVRVLRPGGRFIFVTLGSKTLFELRESYERSFRELGSSGTPHLHTFVDKDTLQQVLSGVGFSGVSVRSVFEREYHRDVRDFLVALKAIGAQNAVLRDPAGLGKPSVFKRMVAIYEDHYGTGLSIPATYELLYAAARKGGPQDEDGYQ